MLRFLLGESFSETPDHHIRTPHNKPKLTNDLQSRAEILNSYGASEKVQDGLAVAVFQQTNQMLRYEKRGNR